MHHFIIGGDKSCFLAWSNGHCSVIGICGKQILKKILWTMPLLIELKWLDVQQDVFNDISEMNKTKTWVSVVAIVYM